ncbi:DUF4116 domain-containing protein [Endozoicomonas sp. SESOKO2]|uniref:DUF4116 domain-containing protein n=2 Tax=unclassified Endozoicomonas TaxID=2644528 RepID=UPI002148B7DD|nr:DUF4116 domain-containing protein [Endozoicomonas sp. SESOKO2]
MFNTNSDKSNDRILTTYASQNIWAGSPSKGADSSPKRYLDDSDPSGVSTCETPLAKRLCSLSVSDQTPPNREELGGKGLFLWRMKKADLSVPPFKCVTSRVMNALEQHPLDTHCLARYLPMIDCELEAETEISLTRIRARLNALPPSEQTKRNSWLAGLAKFIASDDYYEQVKDSEAARQIGDLRSQLDRLATSRSVIVRSSGINEDNYGDAQAGKYLSLVQGEEDILRTCLKVMASAYQPEVCSEGIPQPMALVIQQCIDCKYGGVVMSFQAFQDDTVRVEYTQGQPRGIVAGQSGNTPHRIDIYRKDRKEEAVSSQYFPGTLSSHFILHKNNDGYSETRIDHADAQSNDAGQQLSDAMVAKLREVVTELEDLLLCPVDVEFAIDHQDRLFLLQVRPVTRLSGGMDFAMPIPEPEEILAIGEGISEGYCTGPLWLARERDADSMSEGAIVVAHHAEDWMLEPEFIKRAGGFVLAEAGFNDHVAIFLKQEKITLMRAGEEFVALAARDGQQATLACARFKDEPGAFIVAGDITEKLASLRSLSSAVSDLPLTTAVPSRDDLSPSEGTFSQVARGFQWLTDQNARLLAFFAPGGGLDCLANPIKLSMSPQRSELLAVTRDNVNRLVHGAEALLDGYNSFLQLAGISDLSKVEPWLDELPQLTNRFKALKETIQSELKSVIQPVQAPEEGQLSFRQWVLACRQLQSSLQALNPGKAEQVLSVHELIFALHQRFVKALAPVALASGQGKISRIWPVTYADCRTPGGPVKKVPLFSRSCKASLVRSECPATVIIMDDALIVNLELGHHVGLIELLEHAEGGKGRTLRLKFSDRFKRADGSDGPGKLKRMWFLTQLLKAINLDEHADSMKFSCNAVAGEIIVECSNMKSREIMPEAFIKLITALSVIKNLDEVLKSTAIFEGVQWSFNSLVHHLDSDVTTEAYRFAFEHCLFLIVHYAQYYINRDCFRLLIQLLNNHQKEFIHHSRRFFESIHTPLEVLMSDEIAEDTRKELLQHFLLLEPDKATPLFEDVYDLGDQYFVVNPSCSCSVDFEVPPAHSLRVNRENIKNVLRRQGLKYASQRVRNDKDLVLATIAVYPYNLKYVSERLKRDKQVVLSCFKALNLWKTEEVRRVNDLIFELHGFLIKARVPVTRASALSVLSRDNSFIYVDCTTPGGSSKKLTILSPSCRASLRESRPLTGTVISMDHTLIVNFELSGFAGFIELLENEEEGEGGTLRLKFSENFYRTDGSDAPGKLKRMWFLVQLLKAMELDKNADSMKSGCNAAAAEVIVKCPRMTSRQAMEGAFVKLITALQTVNWLDWDFLSSSGIFEGDQWNLNLLAQRLDSDVAAEANRFAFQHCLLLMADTYRYGIDRGCYQLLNNHLKQFIDHCHRLVKSKDNLREMFMSDELPEDIRRELLHHFLLLHPGKANRWVDLVYPHLKDHYFVIKPSSGYNLNFDFLPVQSLGDHKEKLRNVLLKDGLKYASQRICNDKDLVLATVALHPYSLEYVSEELKGIAEVVMLAIARDGYHLQYASPTLRDDEKVVIAAVASSLGALQYASERIRSDRNIIKTLITVNINCLMYVDKTVLQDHDYMLDLIEKDAHAFTFVAIGLKHDEAFIEAAKKRNSEVSQYLT